MENWQKKIKKWANKPFVRQLAKKFGPADIFLVGGAVRDAILNRETKDFDFVIRGVNKNELEKFLAKQGKVSLVGKKFGVFKFRPKGWTGEDIDIALPRTEHSLNLSGAYRDFKINSNAKLKIEDDLSRRDFTINAMAFRIADDTLIDPFKGLADLKKGVLRAVSKPELRFQEDYSRILRAIRLACQLNLNIETKTWTAIKKGVKNLNQKMAGERIVPYEVIAKELVKALDKNPVWAIELLEQSGALKILMPELLKMKGCPQPKNWHTEGDCWQHTILSIKKLQNPAFKKEFKNELPSREVVWGLLFHDLGKPYTITKTDRLRFNNHDTVAAKKFEEIAQRLKLSAAGLQTQLVAKIIAKHMLPAHSKETMMRDTTIEKYFFNPDFPGQQLLMLTFADIAATIHSNGRPSFSEYNKIKAKIKILAKKSKNKKVLPKPIVTGHDLINQLKIKPGPKIGWLLSLAREAQLSGKIKTKSQGIKYLKRHL